MRRASGAPNPMNPVKRYHGLTWNRYLGTILQAMGLARSEYEKNGVAGYSHPLVSKENAAYLAPGIMNQAGDFLPFLKA
jgi:hypothetical protein